MEIDKSRLVFRVISGSIAYGTSDENSDEDIREVVMNTPEELLGLPSFETTTKSRTEDVVTHSLVKYVRLLLKGNFNAHEWLWAPEDCIKICSPLGTELRERAGEFLHDGIGRSILGYLDSQVRLMQRGRISTRDLGKKRKLLIDTYGYDTKAAYHVYRLAICGYMIYTHGIMKPRLSDAHVELMKMIKYNKFSFDKTFSILENAIALMKRARGRNEGNIRDKAPYKTLNDILVKANYELVKGELK